MRIVSWNVNGLRSILKKNFCESVEKMNPDILCLQEIKADESVIPEVPLPEYEKFFNPAKRKGYSGTAIFAKISPKNVNCRTTMDSLTGPTEGRVIVAEYATFWLVNVYTPNSGEDLKRLEFRHKIWDVGMAKMVENLRTKKPVILCGDMNVAHCEIDLSRPEANHFSPGFTDEEREGMTNLLAKCGVDSFRKLYPDAKNCYSWWSYRMRARERNIGWRIDYAIVDELLADKIESAFIFGKILGSDHAPIGMDICLRP
ncbi:MAG: exodeoxyribonuclease III [Puniceicoccales bacterium]|nr:exodeoxyribonuclease III [Puniceicoccales bacterium]